MALLLDEWEVSLYAMVFSCHDKWGNQIWIDIIFTNAKILVDFSPTAPHESIIESNSALVCVKKTQDSHKDFHDPDLFGGGFSLTSPRSYNPVNNHFQYLNYYLVQDEHNVPTISYAIGVICKGSQRKPWASSFFDRTLY
jgi:hypothetical protein